MAKFCDLRVLNVLFLASLLSPPVCHPQSIGEDFDGDIRTGENLSYLVPSAQLNPARPVYNVTLREASLKYNFDDDYDDIRGGRQLPNYGQVVQLNRGKFQIVLDRTVHQASVNKSMYNFVLFLNEMYTSQEKIRNFLVKLFKPGCNLVAKYIDIRFQNTPIYLMNDYLNNVSPDALFEESHVKQYLEMYQKARQNAKAKSPNILTMADKRRLVETYKDITSLITFSEDSNRVVLQMLKYDQNLIDDVIPRLFKISQLQEETADYDKAESSCLELTALENDPGYFLQIGDMVDTLNELQTYFEELLQDSYTSRNIPRMCIHIELILKFLKKYVELRSVKQDNDLAQMVAAEGAEMRDSRYVNDILRNYNVYKSLSNENKRLLRRSVKKIYWDTDGDIRETLSVIKGFHYYITTVQSLIIAIKTHYHYNPSQTDDFTPHMRFVRRVADAAYDIMKNKYDLYFVNGRYNPIMTKIWFNTYRRISDVNSRLLTQMVVYRTFSDLQELNFFKPKHWIEDVLLFLESIFDLIYRSNCMEEILVVSTLKQYHFIYDQYYETDVDDVQLSRRLYRKVLAYIKLVKMELPDLSVRTKLLLDTLKRIVTAYLTNSVPSEHFCRKNLN